MTTDDDERIKKSFIITSFCSDIRMPCIVRVPIYSICRFGDSCARANEHRYTRGMPGHASHHHHRRACEYRRLSFIAVAFSALTQFRTFVFFSTILYIIFFSVQFSAHCCRAAHEQRRDILYTFFALSRLAVRINEPINKNIHIHTHMNE